uniref:Uncharacterized protein n=1 Tax=Anguilla anguilla TaxID=7936 RepID=A0A0E9T5A0_ANGAN
MNSIFADFMVMEKLVVLSPPGHLRFYKV